MRKIISKHIFHPLFARWDSLYYGDEYSRIKFELEKEKYDEKFQFQNIRELLTYAYQNSPFYYNFYSKNNFRPEDFNGLKDITKIPILEKNHIRDNLDDFIAPFFKKDELIGTATGGTTGNSFTFYYDRDCYKKRQALTNIANERYQWEIGDPAGIVWSAQQDLDNPVRLRSKIRKYLENRIFTFDATTINDNKISDWVKVIKKEKIKILYGYAHSIFLMAQYIVNNQLEKIPVETIITTAEPVSTFHRQIIEAAFQGRVYNRYASREHGPMAQECENGRMHYYANSIYIENLNDSVDPGKPGHLLITDFWNRACPFIRYRIGDVGTISTTKCACNSNLPSLDSLTGRDTDFLVATDGSLVAGMSFMAPIFTQADGITGGKREYAQIQIIQNDQYHVNIKLIKGPGYNEKYDEDFLRKVFKSKLGKDMSIDFEYVSYISKSKSGKYRFTLNNIKNFNIS